MKKEKLFNNGTMTSSAFFSMLRSALRRQSSRGWKPIQQTKLNSRRKYTGDNKRQKFEYKCNVCGEYFPDKEISIDHISPVGSLTSYSDLPKFVETLFCEMDNLQTICNCCHQKKTNEERKLKKGEE